MAKTLDRGWEVEWCVEIPIDESGESDHDSAKFRFRDFETEEKAMEFAKTILDKDQYGAVRVTEFWMEPYEPGRPGKYREYGRQEYVDE